MSLLSEVILFLLLKYLFHSKPESITMERQSLQKTMDTLNKAMRAIKKDPE